MQPQILYGDPGRTSFLRPAAARCKYILFLSQGWFLQQSEQVFKFSPRVGPDLSAVVTEQFPGTKTCTKDQQKSPADSLITLIYNKLGN